MSAPNDGGPAYPTHQNVFRDGVMTCGEFGGMTLRDYFAAAALTGMVARFGFQKNDAAEVSYWYADAMLAERAKGGGK